MLGNITYNDVYVYLLKDRAILSCQGNIDLIQNPNIVQEKMLVLICVWTFLFVVCFK